MTDPPYGASRDAAPRREGHLSWRVHYGSVCGSGPLRLGCVTASPRGSISRRVTLCAFGRARVGLCELYLLDYTSSIRGQCCYLLDCTSSIRGHALDYCVLVRSVAFSRIQPYSSRIQSHSGRTQSRSVAFILFSIRGLGLSPLAVRRTGIDRQSTRGEQCAIAL